MAPELFIRRAEYTLACDIYSLAVTLWELAARKVPFSNAVSESLVQQWVQSGEREDIPPNCPEYLTKLITQGWSGNPGERPSASEIVQRLQGALPSCTPEPTPSDSNRGNTVSSDHVIDSGYRPNTGNGDYSGLSDYRGNVSTLPSAGSYRPNMNETALGEPHEFSGQLSL